MIATKQLFPYQAFQGDHVLEHSSDGEESSEDEDDVANSMFCMAADIDPTVVEEQRQVSALRAISKRVTQLDAAIVAQLPPHYRWLVESFAAVAVEHPLVFETATNHDLILAEFKEAPQAVVAAGERGEGGGGGGGTPEDGAPQKLGKFWKAGTYGEITCPAMDIVADLAVRRPGLDGARVENIVWYDLGSGVGKAVLQFALQHRIRRAVGIELARARHDIAAAARDWLRAKGAPFLSVEDPQIVCGSFTDRIYQDATHIFANSLLFGPELEREVAGVLAGCPQLFQVVSTTRLPLPSHVFRLRRERLQLPVSWQEEPQQAFVFERRPVPPPSLAAVRTSAEAVGVSIDPRSFAYAQRVALAEES